MSNNFLQSSYNILVTVVWSRFFLVFFSFDKKLEFGLNFCVMNLIELRFDSCTYVHAVTNRYASSFEKKFL